MIAQQLLNDGAVILTVKNGKIVAAP